MNKIEKVSIALKPNVYRTFRNLVNTVSNTFGEFVDNAVQSYLNNREALRTIEPGYKLIVDIDINWEQRNLTIWDNAAGIDSNNYLRAFEPAHIPEDVNGLNEFGMGMKTASVWLADKWCVRTKALGESVARYTEFDLDKVTRDEKEELVVKEENEESKKHYTQIVLSQLSDNAPKPGQIDKIKRHLSSIYRHFLRSGEVVIKVCGTELVAPEYEVLKAPFYKTPEREEIVWRKEIDFKIDGYSAKGFIAILDKMQNGANGLVLMRRGRVIVGGGEERFFPSVLFTQPGNFRYKRLFGELELEGFEVTFNKNGFRDEDELYALMEGIRDELKAEKYNLLSQADNYRQRSKEQIQKLSKDIAKDLAKESNNSDLTEQVSKVEAEVTSDVEAPAEAISENPNVLDIPNPETEPLGSHNNTFKYNGEDYILKMELADGQENQPLYSVQLSPNSSQNIFNPKEIICRINLSHPFFTRFDQFKKSQDFKPIIEIFKSLALAEIMAPEKGTIQGSMIRILFNRHILS